MKNAGLSEGRLVGLLLGLGVLTGFCVMMDGLRVDFPKDGLLQIKHKRQESNKFCYAQTQIITF